MPLVDSGQLENAAEQRDALGCFCGTEGWKCDRAAVIDMPERMPVIIGASVRIMERVGEAVGCADSGIRRESCRPFSAAGTWRWARGDRASARAFAPKGKCLA